MVGLLGRLERATHAFLADPAPPVRLDPAVRHTALTEAPTIRLHHTLTERDRGALREHAMGLLDPDVRGWLIVTIREHHGHADIDVDARIPEGVLPGVNCALAEVVPA